MTRADSSHKAGLQPLRTHRSFRNLGVLMTCRGVLIFYGTLNLIVFFVTYITHTHTHVATEKCGHMKFWVFRDPSFVVMKPETILRYLY